MTSLFIASALVLGFQGSASDELQALVKADQRDRQFTEIPSMEVVHRMERADFAREERVRQLLREDKVRSGADLDAAALIFQHGGDPDDYMAARELSVLAYAKGKRGTLQAAAEDRYLLSIGQKQRFGNQFQFDAAGKPVFQALDESGLAAVTDAHRADFAIAPVKFIRERGMKAFSDMGPALFARAKERVKPAWIAAASKRPASLELAGLYQANQGKDFDHRVVARVLEMYRLDRIATPSDLFHAASLLMASSEAQTVLLANELAALAVSRGSMGARRTFVRSWDKYLVILGKPDRYGTMSGRHLVSPIVAREFGLIRR